MCPIPGTFWFSLWDVSVPRGRRTNSSLWLWQAADFGMQLLGGVVTALLPLLQMELISSLTCCTFWVASWNPRFGSVIQCSSSAKISLIFLQVPWSSSHREVMALFSCIFLCFGLFSVLGVRKWGFCSTLGVILLCKIMSFENIKIFAKVRAVGGG